MRKRRKLGLVLPSSNTTMELEFTRYLPARVSLHVARMPITEVTAEGLSEMSEWAVEAARLLRDAGVDLLLYGCTSGSFIKGLGFDLALQERMEKATGIKAMTTSRAVLDVLSKLGAKRVAVGTPYLEEVNTRLKGFLEGNGFEVATMRGLNILRNVDIGNLEPADAFRLGLEVASAPSEVIFLSCTNFRTFEALSPLTRVVGRPVISSNQASMYAALKALGVEERPEILDYLS